MITAVVCSDDRMFYTCKYLCKGLDVIAIDESTDFLTLPAIDVLVLPVKGIDEDGYLQFKSVRRKVPSLFWKMQKDIKIISGLATTYLDCLPFKKYYYMKDQKVIEDNAILTAEGVLHLLIISIEKSLYEISVDIIGYGNCGKAIKKMLDNLDVNVRVIRRSCTEDEEFIEVANWEQPGDVIVNTSIDRAIVEDMVEKWDHKPVVIDISTPDVIDKHMLEKHGVAFMKAGNLPGKFCAESAGRVIACYVRGIVDER